MTEQDKLLKTTSWQRNKGSKTKPKESDLRKLINKPSLRRKKINKQLIKRKKLSV